MTHRLHRSRVLAFLLAGVALCILVPSHANAAAAYVQSRIDSNGATGDAGLTTGTLTTTSGNLLVVGVMWYTAGACGTPSVSDSKSNSWNAVSASFDNGTFCFQGWYAYNITGGSGHTITVNPTADEEVYIITHEVSGIQTTSDPLDKQASDVNDAGTAVDIGPVTTVTDGQYIAGFLFCHGDPCAISPSGSFNEREDTGGSYPHQSQDMVQTSAGSITATWTLSNTSAASGLMATFKAAPAASPPAVTTLSKPPNNLGLVGYWSFNEGTGTIATDFSGNGNAGTLTGPPTWVNGKRGKALNFSSGSHYVDLGTNVSIAQNLQQMTIAMWVKRTVDSSNEALLEISTNNGGTPTTNSRALLEITTADDPQCGGRAPDSDPKQSVDGDNIIPVDNTWHSFICTINFATDSILIYIDGVLQPTTGSPSFTNTTTDDTTSAVAVIGAQDDGSGDHFGGHIDEVRIYNRVLSATEITKLYQAGAVKFTTSSVELQKGSTLGNGLVGHWTFDGPDVTTTIADKSGNGNNGSFVGGAVSSAKVIGKLGQALSFNGTSQYIPTAVIAALDNISEMTISAWVYQDSTTASKSVVSAWSFNGFVFFTSDSGQGGGDDIECTPTGASNTEGYTTANIHQAGRWEHVVCVFDGTQTGNSNRLNIYLNGAAQSLSFPGTVPATTDTANNVVTLGADEGGGAYWNGKLDDIRLYDRALTATEIKQLYNLGRATIIP